MKIRRMLKVLLPALILGLPAMAGDIVLGVNGRTKHQIVIPDSYPNAAAEESVSRAAELMKQCFAANQIKMAVVKESSKDPKRHGIYLGATRFAGSNGVKVSDLTGWQHTAKAVGKNLILAGHDAPNPIKAYSKRPYLGTLHGAAEFLYRHAGARFLKPGADGIVFLPRSIVAIPDTLNETREPWFLEHEWYWRQYKDFNIANHAVQFQKTWSHWGHQHPVAIPKAKYAKTHPEYFVLSGGLRNPESGQYCLSNPAVQKLIYQHILDRCDEGYEIVELGQSDGFVPCQCKACFESYGIRPSTKPENASQWINDPVWGEKIWKMHCDMAKRLKQDRPGKKVMISAYTVTAKPPRNIHEFPDNVIIEMMQASPENFEAWSSKKVPGGYAAYLYSWGNFHLPGYTPLNEISCFGKESELFTKYNVRIVQVNGLPHQYGLEGPNIYAYLRLGVDPHYKNASELFQEYLEAAFYEAETPMRRFFTKLQRSAAYFQLNRPLLLKMGRDPIKTFTVMYMPDQLRSMEEDLANAEKQAVSPGVKNRLATVRAEFDFLKNIVNVVYRWHDFNNRKDRDSFVRLLDAVEARNRQIADMVSRKGTPYNPTLLGADTLKKNGKMLDIPPFNWNVEEMRKNGFASLVDKTVKAYRVSSMPTLNSPEVNKIPAEPLAAENGSNAGLTSKTNFRVMYDDENLYICVTGSPLPGKNQRKSRGRDAEIWLQESIVFQISPKADKSQYYYFAYDAAADSFADAEHGFITDTYDPRFGWNDWTWNGKWKYENKFGNGEWRSMAVIPWKTVNAEPPKKGDIWYFNLGRVHFDADGKRELSVWNHKMNPSRVPGDAVLGKLHFE
ncbi:MAG: DUF4838 domain-containing protein [Lentisphaeria bacterium]|nr:DUF4838 domain-containing protein [Lentisphaeria bacterium]